MLSKRVTLSATLFTLFSVTLHFFVTIYLLHESQFILDQSLYRFLLILLLSTSFINIALSWLTSSFILQGMVLGISIINAILIILHSGETPLNGFILFYCIFWGALFYVDSKFRRDFVATQLLIERDEETENQLQNTLDKARSEVELDFGKYSNYFKLREVADKFATSLSLKKVANIIIDETQTLLNKGDTFLLYLVDVEEHQLSLVASKTKSSEKTAIFKTGAVFDHWLLKSQQHLIVTDLAKDFRFDYVSPDKNNPIRSLIAAPLVNEGRVIGALRVNAADPETFSTDDLRLLNILSVLASSAIWNALLYKQTEELAIRDSLTNLFVQRYFKQRLMEEHRRSLLTNAPLSLIMSDLDHFKQYNDKYGHAAGDLVLRNIAKILKETLGKDGLIARYGGEEFAVILPNTTKKEAKYIAENLRDIVEKTPIDLRGTKTQITISIGVATFPEDTLDYEDLILKADRKLYDAKKKGRNQVC